MKVIETKRVPIGSLTAYPGNARRGNLEMIRESLRENGQYKPIVARAEDMTILAGNHTWQGAQDEGWTDILVTIVDCTPVEARKIVLVDNKSNDVAGYDNTALAELLGELEGDFDGTGFAKTDLDSLLDSLLPDEPKEPNQTPGITAPSRVTEGDLWELGPHRLVCGSALDFHILEKVMGGETAALVVTSPPYNQQLDSFKPSGMQKENPAWVERMASSYSDSLPEDEYQEQQKDMLRNLFAVMSDNGSVFYNHKIRYRDKQVLSPFQWLNDEGNPFRIRQEIIWDRSGSITLNARMFMPQDERIYWMTRSEDFVFNDTSEIKAYGTVWQIAPRVEVQISAPYPIELPSRAILACSGRDDIVLDPYGGSGTTMMAAEQLGRRGYAVEINPEYCDVILQRYEALTGNKAQLVED